MVSCYILRLLLASKSTRPKTRTKTFFPGLMFTRSSRTSCISFLKGDPRGNIRKLNPFLCGSELWFLQRSAPIFHGELKKFSTISLFIYQMTVAYLLHCTMICYA